MKSPTLEQLTERLGRLQSQVIAVDLVGYRSVTPKYARETDILSGIGSKVTGGRWNPPGLAVIYVSLTPETAMAETLAHFYYRQIPVSAAMPRVFVSLTVQLSKVIDLTDGAIRQRLQISEDSLMNLDWRKQASQGTIPLPQLLGRAAQLAGLEGLQVPSSAMKGGKNLVIFPENLASSSTFAVDRADELPKNVE
ncbi:MAG TPA: RES family NAD+ phosphorylase [Planctomicrobium sp.]|nr:RES family NAD+ phosphorylase [Planctomicrobium sp.]